MTVFVYIFLAYTKMSAKTNPYYSGHTNRCLNLSSKVKGRCNSFISNKLNHRKTLILRDTKHKIETAFPRSIPYVRGQKPQGDER
jgi:hypothetical protein